MASYPRRMRSLDRLLINIPALGSSLQRIPWLVAGATLLSFLGCLCWTQT